MPLIFYGRTRCYICGQPLEQADEIVGFSPFIGNELDPLYEFNDAAMHTACFRTHPLAEKAERVYANIREQAKRRVDVLSGELITTPDEYMGFGYLTDDPASGLYPYNYLCFKKSKFAEWKALAAFYEALDEAIASGTHKGSGYDKLREMVKSALETSGS